MPAAPFRIENNSIVVGIQINGHPVDAILDSGCAFSACLTTTDARTCGVADGPAEGVEGAGGTSSVYEAPMTITLAGTSYPSGQTAAVDPNLEGNSLIGLGYFLEVCDTLTLGLHAGELLMS